MKNITVLENHPRGLFPHIDDCTQGHEHDKPWAMGKQHSAQAVTPIMFRNNRRNRKHVMLGRCGQGWQFDAIGRLRSRSVQLHRFPNTHLFAGTPGACQQHQP